MAPFFNIPLYPLQPGFISVHIKVARKAGYGNSCMHRETVYTSASNPKIKYIRNLLQKKYREETGCFLMEGEKMVSEAFRSDWNIEMVVFSSECRFSESLENMAKNIGVPCIYVDDRVFKTLSDTKTPQGVLAVLKKKEWDRKQLIDQTKGFLAVLDGISDPGNLGTIIRTVEGVGGGLKGPEGNSKGVVLINGGVELYNPKVVRATMGSLLRVPVIREEDAEEFLNEIADKGWHIAVSDLSGEDLFSWQGGYKKTALVIGSESHGVSGQVREKACSLIKSPMEGSLESLNASVAAGIMIYEIFRKEIEKEG